MWGGGIHHSKRPSRERVTGVTIQKEKARDFKRRKELEKRFIYLRAVAQQDLRKSLGQRDPKGSNTLESLIDTGLVLSMLADVRCNFAGCAMQAGSK